MSAMIKRQLAKAKKSEAASDLRDVLDLLEGAVQNFP